MSTVEIIACLFGFLAVAFTVLRNMWCWPTGLIQVVLFVYVFYQNKLYADMILHVIYVGLQIYGWIAWLRSKQKGDDDSPLIVETLSSRKRLAYGGLCVVLTLLFGYLLSTYTDANAPYVDSFIAATSLVAQWLLARRKVENWVLWIIVDIVAIGLYASRNMAPTAILYAAFLVLAIIGLIVWRNAIKQPQSTESAFELT